MDINVLTIPGAAGGALILTTFAKAVGLPGRFARVFAVIIGTVIFLAANLLTAPETGVLFIIVTVIAGAQAGLSAAAGYDTGRSGADYAVIPADDYNAQPGPHSV